MQVTGIRLLGCCLFAAASIHAALPVQTTFTGAKSERTWVLKELDAELPSDWTGYEYARFTGVTDQPYAELVAAARLTHGRLLEVHSGKAPPFHQKPRPSETGTP